jgi:Flp pilus assembly protein TadD
MITFRALFPVAVLIAGCSAVYQPTEAEKVYAALAAGNNAIAARWLTVAVAQKPDDPYLMLDLAAAYQNLGKFDEARDLYHKVIDTAKDVAADATKNPKLGGKALGDIAAANLALLPK